MKTPAEAARSVLRESGLFTPDEQKALALAIAAAVHEGIEMLRLENSIEHDGLHDRVEQLDKKSSHPKDNIQTKKTA